MTRACDERSPGRGGEKEEPNEPPPRPCRLRVIGGASVLPRLDAIAREPFYEYNASISSTGYMVRPVHRVYKRSGGRRRVYVYYGRYWWRRKGKRLVYAGVRKPRRVRAEPPEHPLMGLSLIIDGDDLIVDCAVYEAYRDIFRGLEVREEY